MGAGMRYLPQGQARLARSGIGRNLRFAVTPGMNLQRVQAPGVTVVPSPAVGGGLAQAFRNSATGASSSTLYIPIPSVTSKEWTFAVMGYFPDTSGFQAMCEFNDGLPPVTRFGLSLTGFPGGFLGADIRPYATDFATGTAWDSSKPGLLIVTISVAANQICVYYQGVLIGSGALSSTSAVTVNQLQLFGKNGDAYSDSAHADSRILLAAMWDRAINAKEATELYRNPGQIFAESDDDDLRPSGGVVDTPVNPANGSLALAGFAPTVVRGANVALTPGAAALALVGYAPAISQSAVVALSPTPGAVAITGYAPMVVQGAVVNVSPAPGVLSITGYAPAVTRTALQNVAPAPASLSVIGYAPAVAQSGSVSLLPTPGAIAVVGYAPTILRGVTLTFEPVPAALQLTGYAPTVSQANNLKGTVQYNYLPKSSLETIRFA